MIADFGIIQCINYNNERGSALINKQNDDYNNKPQDRNKQYHPAFYAAMELEFREDKDHLTYYREYNLNTKPNSIDFLVINADTDVKVHSELGAIFKKHNIIEYKSPRHSLDVSVYYRTIGYAYLYQTYGVGESNLDDMTITFIRKGYPRALVKWLKEQGFEIVQYRKGIYHVTRQWHIDMQLVITSRLEDTCTWINKLTSGLEMKDIKSLEKEIGTLDDKQDLINAESVMDLIFRLNKKEMKEAGKMGEFRDFLNELAEEHIKDLEKQLQKKEEKLQKNEILLKDKDAQIKEEKNKNKLLTEELEQIKQQLKGHANKIAMF